MPMQRQMQMQGRCPRELLPRPRISELVASSASCPSRLEVSYTGHDHELLRAAVARFEQRLHRPGPRTRALGETWQLELCCEESPEPFPWPGQPEAYTIDVGSDKRMRLQAQGLAGILHGLETLLQLTAPGQGIARGHIEDAPRFPWRGLLLDPSRHFLSVESVKRCIRGMAACKLNVLHLHLTDDQGFRVECRPLPGLHEKGSGGRFYRYDDISELVEFAALRGIRIVPEFDMPGHATSWLAGYPELTAKSGPFAIEKRYGRMDAYLDPGKDELYPFLEIFFAEMASLFPDPYVHIGGDEVKGPVDQHAFIRRLESILDDNGKKLIGWQEILHPELGPHSIIQIWQGGEPFERVCEDTRPCLVSHSFFLDQMLPAQWHHANGLPGTDLRADAAASVLGAEACLWGEFVDENNLCSRLWPRLAAIADLLWSGESKDEDLHARLACFEQRLGLSGINPAATLAKMLDTDLEDKSERAALKTTLSALVPLGTVERLAMENHTTDTVLDRYCDHVAVWSDDALAFFRDLPPVSDNGYDVAALKRCEGKLGIWRYAASRLRKLESCPERVSEVLPIAKQVETVATIGQKVLRQRTQMHGVAGSKKQEWLTTLEKAKEPVACLRIGIIDSIIQLITSPPSGHSAGHSD